MGLKNICIIPTVGTYREHPERRYGWFYRDVPHENRAFLIHRSSFDVVWLEDSGCCDPTVQENAVHHVLEVVVVEVHVGVLTNKVAWEPPFHPQGQCSEGRGCLRCLLLLLMVLEVCISLGVDVVEDVCPSCPRRWEGEWWTHHSCGVRSFGKTSSGISGCFVGATIACCPALQIGEAGTLAFLIARVVVVLRIGIGACVVVSGYCSCSLRPLVNLGVCISWLGIVGSHLGLTGGWAGGEVGAKHGGVVLACRSHEALEGVEEWCCAGMGGVGCAMGFRIGGFVGGHRGGLGGFGVDSQLRDLSKK